jgi:hypothetical protein
MHPLQFGIRYDTIDMGGGTSSDNNRLRTDHLPSL